MVTTAYLSPFPRDIEIFVVMFIDYRAFLYNTTYAVTVSSIFSIKCTNYTPCS